MNLLVSLLFGLVFFFALLLAAALEWWLCIVFSMPIIMVGVILGTAIGYWIRRKIEGDKKDENTTMSLLPLAVLLFAGTIEHYFVDKYDRVKVSTAIYLPYSPDKVYDFIKSVDTLNTEKPFVMSLGLPVPEKYVLAKEEVGSTRTCYFENGKIEEKITALRRGAILKMDVTNCTVPMPKWLKFEEAIYLFKQQGNGTLLTRITTYRTELKPRFYWRWFEAKAIEAEHEYVLNDLKRRLDGK